MIRNNNGEYMALRTSNNGKDEQMFKEGEQHKNINMFQTIITHGQSTIDFNSPSYSLSNNDCLYETIVVE